MVRTSAEASQVGRNCTRQDCLNAIANVLPEFMGGSADLAPSNMTLPLRQEDFKMFHVVDHYEGATVYLYLLMLMVCGSSEFPSRHLNMRQQCAVC